MFSQSVAFHSPHSKFLLGTKSGRLALALGYSLAAFWSKSSATLRSAHGHWRTQISTRNPSVDFGPALQCLPSRSFQPRVETQARIRGIDSLVATRPWVDIVDMQIFLEGFEAGAQWCRSNQDSGSESDRHVVA